MAEQISVPPDPPVPGVPGPSRGLLLFVGLAAGLTYWFTHRDRAAGFGEDDEDEDDFEDDDEDFDDEDDDFEPPAARFRDATTDSLLDEPAVVAESGRPADCKKAAMLLLRRQALVNTERERGLFNKVVRKVASDCRGAEEAVQEAIDDAAARREEAEQAVGMKLIRSPYDTSRLPAESGFRKSKRTLKRTTTTEHGDARSKGRGRSGRPGQSPMRVKKASGERFKLRKEKAKTKRGYTWRREDDE